MKILVVGHTYIVDVNCQKWLKLSQLEPNIEVTVVVPKQWFPGGVHNKDCIRPEFLSEGSFRRIPIPTYNQSRERLLLFDQGIISLLQDFQPDIIQTEQGSKGLSHLQMILLNRALKLNAKNLFFTWWNIPHDPKFCVPWLEAYNLRHTDGIICGNQAGIELVRRRGYQGPIKLSPQLGVDEKQVYSQPQSQLAAKLGITSGDFVIGFIGRFVSEKGLLLLGEALDLLAQENTSRPWKCLMLGSGPFYDVVKRNWRERGLDNRVIWIKSVPHEEVFQYINLMSTLVLPSQTSYFIDGIPILRWKEQFGHVLIEAMACKVPVIGSSSGAIPEVIDSSGLIFPEGDVYSLKHCIQRLLDNCELCQQLGEAGYQRVMSKYTNNQLANDILAFYKTLLEKPACLNRIKP